MKYNGKELTEADGEDYKLGMTPKKMLVWDNEDGFLLEREVIGYINGCWVAVDIANDAGACNWLHAAEFPSTPSLRPFKSAKELDDAVTVHGPYIINVDTGTRTIIASYDDTTVRDPVNTKAIQDLINKFTFLDGAPFGVVEA